VRTGVASLRHANREAFAEWLDRGAELWSRPSSLARDCIAILVILAISAITAMIGAAHTRMFGHDIFVLLDSGWRVLNGQRPAVDFSSGIAPLTSLIMAAGMGIAHNAVRGVGYASALVAGIAGLWSYLLTRRQMAWVPATLASAGVALIAAAPFPLGLPANRTSHAMVYNRYGFALLGVVLLDTFQTSSVSGRARSLFNAISVGIVTVLLFFLKPSYGLVAFVFVGFSLLMRWQTRWRFLGVSVGAVSAFLAVMAWLRFDFRAVWSDLRILGLARSSELSFASIPWALAKGVPELLMIITLALLVSVVRTRSEGAVGRFEPLLAAVIATLGGALLLATNAQPGGYPLTGLFALVLAGRTHAIPSGSEAPAGFLRANVVIPLFALVSFGSAFDQDAGGLVYAFRESFRHPSESIAARFHEPQLAPLVLHEVEDGSQSDLRSNGRVFVNYVNDGVDLIRRYTKPDETVFNIDFTNPFSYALQRRPARGGTVAMFFDHQFTDRYKPSPQWYFGYADVLTIPKHPSIIDSYAQALFRNYLPAIQAQYRLCASSDWFELWKRPSHLEGCPGR